MHERRQNQTSHYSRQNRYFLSIGRAMEQNQILQVTSSKGKAYRVCVRRTATWLVRPATHGGMRVVLHFHLQVGPQLSKPTIGKPPPRPPRDGCEKRIGGRRDGCSMDSKKIGVGWDSCGWRVPYC